jgi:hypothetical protein
MDRVSNLTLIETAAPSFLHLQLFSSHPHDDIKKFQLKLNTTILPIQSNHFVAYMVPEQFVRLAFE